jgi:hypothetical protein
MYSDQCTTETENLELCISFNNGILKKGLYSTVVNFWQDLTTINNDFLGSRRNITDTTRYLNNAKLL